MKRKTKSFLPHLYSVCNKPQDIEADRLIMSTSKSNGNDEDNDPSTSSCSEASRGSSKSKSKRSINLVKPKFQRIFSAELNPQKSWYLLDCQAVCGRQVSKVLQWDVPEAFPNEVQSINIDDVSTIDNHNSKGVKKKDGVLKSVRQGQIKVISGGLLVLVHCRIGQVDQSMVGLPQFKQLINLLNQVPLEDLFQERTTKILQMFLSARQEERLPLSSSENMLSGRGMSKDNTQKTSTSQSSVNLNKASKNDALNSQSTSGSSSSSMMTDFGHAHTGSELF